MKVDWSFIVVFVVLLGYMWFSIDQIAGLEEDKAVLQSQVGAFQAANEKLSDQNDVNLAELYEAKKTADDELERQFYRGVYAAAIVIVQGKGGSVDVAVKAATDFVQGAITAKAYQREWPGFNDKQEYAPGTAPQLAPEPPKGKDKNA